MDIAVEVCRKENTFLVQDEILFLVKVASYFPSLFQKYIDHDFAELDMAVIICGSSIRMMNDLLNEKRGLLFGIFDCRMRLEPLNYLLYCEFFSKIKIKNVLHPELDT